MRIITYTPRSLIHRSLAAHQVRNLNLEANCLHFQTRGPQPDEQGGSPRAELPSIPLETMGPVGYEAGRQPSSGTMTFQQIHRDIDDSYECGICFEAINRQNNIWHCDCCWGIYHDDCIVDCARGSRRGEAEVPIVALGQQWKCPACRKEYEGPPIQTCCESWRPRT